MSGTQVPPGRLWPAQEDLGAGGRQQSQAGQAVFVESSQATSCQENSLFQIQGVLLTWIRDMGVKLLAERPKRPTEWMDPGRK